MKVDLIRKFKWYIIGFILVAIMLSVSLSFCVWDNMSLKAKLTNSGSGWFSDKERLYTLEVDSNSNYIVDVGDIVSFGKYYQNANTATKTPIRWIVVEKENNQLTLLAEKVMAFGSFWGNWYNDGTTNSYNPSWGLGWNWLKGTTSFYYQNYSKSTLRAWLNSYYSNDEKTNVFARNDNGAAFSAGNSQPRFRGFYSEAFDDKEKAYIVSKTMSGMKGYGKDNNPSTRTENYASISDRVWVPSWSEVYGTANTENLGWDIPVGGDWNTYDGDPTPVQFSYFKNNNCYYNKANPTLNGYTTAFASSQYSNYTVAGATSSQNMQNTVKENSNVWWWLRSPSPSYYPHALLVNGGGRGDGASTHYSGGGVRPAIIIPA